MNQQMRSKSLGKGLKDIYSNKYIYYDIKRSRTILKNIVCGLDLPPKKVIHF